MFMKKCMFLLIFGIHFSAQAMLKNFKEIEIEQSSCFGETVLAFIPNEHIGALSKSSRMQRSLFVVPDSYINQDNAESTNRFLDLLYTIPREKWAKVNGQEVMLYDFRKFCELLTQNLVCSSCREREVKEHERLSKIDMRKIDLIVRTTPNNAAAILAAYSIGCGVIGFGLGATFAFLMNKE